MVVTHNFRVSGSIVKHLNYRPIESACENLLRYFSRTIRGYNRKHGFSGDGRACLRVVMANKTKRTSSNQAQHDYGGLVRNIVIGLVVSVLWVSILAALFLYKDKCAAFLLDVSRQMSAVVAKKTEPKVDKVTPPPVAKPAPKPEPEEEYEQEGVNWREGEDGQIEYLPPKNPPKPGPSNRRVIQ